MEYIKPIDIAKLFGVEKEYDKLLLEQELKNLHDTVMGESTLLLDYTPEENKTE